MSEDILKNEELTEKEEVFEEPILEELPVRENPFCVIAKEPWENGGRDLQSNGAWSKNPYGDGYAVVPDEIVPAIMETKGFCDIVLNEDGTEVVSFTAREIPEIPEVTPEPSTSDVLDVLLGVE